MFEEISVGIVGQEDDISILGARRVLTEYKVPFNILDETELAHKINYYSLLLINASKSSSHTSDLINSFLKRGGVIIFYGKLSAQYKEILHLSFEEKSCSNTNFKLLLCDNHPIANDIEKREISIMEDLILVTDYPGYDTIGEFVDVRNDLRYPSVIVNEQKNIIYISFDICQQVVLWETENYGKTHKINLFHSTINKIYNYLPYFFKRKIKRYSRKVRKEVVNKSFSYTNFPIEYNSDTLKVLLINSIRYLSINSVEFIPFLSKWPSGYEAAMVITHDVDTYDDYKNGLPILRGIEDRHNVKSTWCFVANGSEYIPSSDLLSDLASNGHEIASHGLYHNIRSDLLSSEERKKCMVKSKEILESCLNGYSIDGYRSPGLTRTFDLCALVENSGYKYDMSYPDNDHYNIRHFGMGVSSHIPYNPIIKLNSKYKELEILELPLSALQEATLFIDQKLNENEAISFWIKKGEQIVSDGGLVVFLFHPSLFKSESRAQMYELLISYFKSKNNLYLTTPTIVVEWWKQRKLIDIMSRKGKEGWEIIVINNSSNSLSDLRLEIHCEKKKKLNIIKGDLESITYNTFKWHLVYYLNIKSIKNSEKLVITFSFTEEGVL